MASRLAEASRKYDRNPSQQNQDAVIGLALRQYHRARLTPTARAIQERGLFATARQMQRNGTHFVDAFVSIFGVMPRHV